MTIVEASKGPQNPTDCRLQCYYIDYVHFNSPIFFLFRLADLLNVLTYWLFNLKFFLAKFLIYSVDFSIFQFFQAIEIQVNFSASGPYDYVHVHSNNRTAFPGIYSWNLNECEMNLLLLNSSTNIYYEYKDKSNSSLAIANDESIESQGPERLLQNIWVET